jgi:asparagine synthetase B (glutamine-hydrolysing)
LLNLPRITVSVARNDTKKLEVAVENCTIPLRVFDDEKSTLVVVGSPVIGEVINRDDIWLNLKENKLSKDFLRNLNGEFLLISLDKSTGQLQVSVDRYTSIPLFYLVDETGFHGSVFYKDLWMLQKQNGHIKLNEHAVFEFLWLQRLLGTKTYDNSSSFLLAATTLTYLDGELSTERYWAPSFIKIHDSIDESAHNLASLLRQSIKRKTSDNPGRIGLFLSGGTDSRTVLAAFEEPPTSFTIGVSDNNEVQVARIIANRAKSTHKYVPFPTDPYSENIDPLTMLGGGMHSFDHSIFYGLNEYVSPEVDVVFHGHGIDYMFQGMYLLTRNLKLFGRPSSFKRLEPIGNDFPGEYLNKIEHRLKEVDLTEYVVDHRRSEMLEQLRHSVEEVQMLGENFCKTADDYWEYMLIHALARHYPFTNLSSMGTLAEQRVIAFDNEIFDLYTSLPKTHRLDGKIAKATLQALNSDMASVPTANTNERPNQSPLSKDISRAIRRIKRKTGLSANLSPDPTAEERTWPDRARMFSTQPKLKNAALELGKSEALSSLGFLDMDRLSRDIPNWVTTPQKGPGALLTFLVTIDRFIRHQ